MEKVRFFQSKNLSIKDEAVKKEIEYFLTIHLFHNFLKIYRKWSKKAKFRRQFSI